MCSRFIGGLIGVLLLLQSGLVTGQQEPSDLAGVITVSKVDELFNANVSLNPADGKAPGAQLAIIDKRGSRYIRGYGVAGSPDAGRDPMDPQRHLYRIASQTKVFTAIGILQLHERGLLDLDADVSDYITAFQIRNPLGGETLSARVLLQHRSGLDDDWAGIALRTQAEHRPLADTFQRRGIRFVRPTGEMVSYTNRAYMLLGHLIEAVSGESYEDYIQNNILDVLDMDNSTFVLDAEDRKNLAWGTAIVDGRFEEVWVADTLTRPSGDLMTNAEDMSHFLAALLGDGSYQGRQLLKPETLEMMFSDCALMGPGLPGHCLGPATNVRDGVRSWGHGGGHPGYASRFVIDRELGFAVFFGFLSSSSNPVGFYQNQFMGTFFPRNTSAPAATPIDRAKDIVGLYRGTWSSMKTPEKLGMLAGSEPEVRIEDHKVAIGPYTYVQVEPLLFRAEGSESYARILLDENGDVAYIQQGSGGLEKIEWYEAGRVQRLVLYICLGLLALYLIWHLANLRHFQPGLWQRDSLSITAAVAALWIVALGLCYLYPSDFSEYQYGFPFHSKLGLMLTKLAALLSVGVMLLYVGNLIKNSYSGLPRLTLTLACLAMLVLIPWSLYWQLI